MFQVGRVYNRISDLQGKYGGQRMGGAMTPKDKPYIFLVPTEKGHENGYREHWEGDVLHITGTGKTGDQEMKGVNYLARYHEALGKALYLFAPLHGSPGNYVYRCRVRCIGDYRQELPGSDGKPHQCIILKLQRLPEPPMPR